MIRYISLISRHEMYFFFFFKQKTAYEMRISDWSSDVCSSDLTRRPTHVDRIKQPPRLVGGQHRRLAAPLTMRRPAHRCGGVHRHDLAYHQPVEQPTHAGELLLDAGRAHLASQRLDPRADVERLHGPKGRDPARRYPGPEVASREIGRAHV